MGKYVNNNRVNLGNYGDAIEYNTAVKEIATLLGVGAREDGRYYLSDICKANSINPLSRCKPIRNEKSANITESDRDADAFGFGDTPRIEPYNAGIPHGVYEYKKPRGSEVSPIEWYRLRDFHGYNHIAVSPLQVYFPESIVREETNTVYCLVNSTGLSGWDDTCLRLQDVVDETTKDYNIALLVHRGSKLWLMPSDIKVRDLDANNAPVFQFARNESELEYNNSDIIFQYILDDLQDATGDSYTIAFVATALGYQSDKTPIATADIPTMRSLELVYNCDRKTLEVITTQAVNLSGYLNVPTWNYTIAEDPSGMSGFKVIKPDQYQKLTVRLTTPDSWRRSTVYINCRIANTGGFIYQNGVMLNDMYVDIGKDIAIGAGETKDVDLLTNFAYPNQYWFQYYYGGGGVDIQFEITAWYNSSMTGESVTLQNVTVRFPNK